MRLVDVSRPAIKTFPDVWHLAPVEDLSDDEYESGDIPFSNAPNAKDEVDELDMEEGDDEEDEEGV